MEPIKWLRASGLPELLGCEGWAVLTELVERDKEQHLSAPGDINASVMDLSRAVGLSTVRLKSILGKLKSKKMIGVFIPDNDLEDCIIRIADPMPTPVAPADLHRRIGGGERWRYAGEEQRRDVTAEEELVVKIARMEIDATGGIVNGMVVDQIREIVRVHGVEKVETALAGAGKWEGGFRIWKLARNIGNKYIQKSPPGGDLKKKEGLGCKKRQKRWR